MACGKVVLRKRTPMVQRRPPHACRVASSWAGRRPQSVSPGRPGLCALAGECTAVSRSGDELTPGVAELPRFVTRGSRGQCAPRGRAGRACLHLGPAPRGWCRGAGSSGLSRVPPYPVFIRISNSDLLVDDCCLELETALLCRRFAHAPERACAGTEEGAVVAMSPAVEPCRQHRRGRRAADSERPRGVGLWTALQGASSLHGDRTARSGTCGAGTATFCETEAYRAVCSLFYF